MDEEEQKAIEHLDFEAPAAVCTMLRLGERCPDEAVWLMACPTCEDPRWFCVCERCRLEIRMTISASLCRRCRKSTPIAQMHWRSAVGA